MAILTWQHGRAMIERLLAEQELELMEVSTRLAKQLVAQARVHLDSA